MWKFIQENIKEFWTGIAGGSVASGGFLFIKQSLLTDTFLSLTLVGISAVIGGMGTALAADFYKHHIQKKLFKNKKNGKSDREKAA